MLANLIRTFQQNIQVIDDDYDRRRVPVQNDLFADSSDEDVPARAQRRHDPELDAVASPEPLVVIVDPQKKPDEELSSSDDNALMFSDSEDSEENSDVYVYNTETDTDSDSDSLNIYDNDPPYEFSLLEDGLYLLRVAGSHKKFVVLTRKDHPLVSFTKTLSYNKLVALRALFHHAPAEYRDLEDGCIPGVLTQLVTEKLYRAPKFLVRDSQTSQDVIVDSLPENAIVPARPEGIDLDSPSDNERVELFLMDPLDTDYHEKKETLIQVQSGQLSAENLNYYDAEREEDNLRPFSAMGYRGIYPNSESATFTGQSPIQNDGVRWYTISMHYYSMYRAFMAFHDQSQSALQTLLKRRSEVRELDYCFGPHEKYTPQQEHAVIERIVEHTQHSATADTAVAVRVDELKKLASQLVDAVEDLKELKVQKSALSVLPLVRDSSATLSDVCGTIGRMEKTLDLLNDALESRFEQNDE